MGGFRADLEDDMGKNHFCRDEFAELVSYVTTTGIVAEIFGLYDVIPISENVGAEVEVIAHRPRFVCRTSDLPAGSPTKGDKITLSANEWHKAATLRVIDTGDDRLGHIEIYLQGPANAPNP